MCFVTVDTLFNSTAMVRVGKQHSTSMNVMKKVRVLVPVLAPGMPM